MIDILHKQKGGKKPRTYRVSARKRFLHISKMRKKGQKTIRKAIRKQLGYVIRDMGYIGDYLHEGYELSEKDLDMLQVIDKVYSQQKEMYDSRKHSVSHRIVSLSQPHIRPIVRGKAGAQTEFGAKFEISMVDGYARMERFSWEAFNESEDLIQAAEKYRQRHRYYPERILVDQLYRNRENLKFCKENKIRITGPPLGRPPKNRIRDRKAEYRDLCDRNAVEGKFGEGKRSYGWARVMGKLASTSEAIIRGNMIVMNLFKTLRLESSPVNQ